MVVPLDSEGNVVHSEADFVNEQVVDKSGSCVGAAAVAAAVESFWRPDPSMENAESVDKCSELPQEEQIGQSKNIPHFMYELTSEDGFKAESMDASGVWRKVFEAVQEARIRHSMTPLPSNPLGKTGLQMLGLTHAALAFLIEQLPGAKETREYKFKHYKVAQADRQDEIIEKESPSGCARSEPFKNRKPFDMLSWLASRHRKLPDFKSSGKAFSKKQANVTSKRNYKFCGHFIQ